MFDSLHTMELTWIHTLHTIRSPFLDGFMKLLNLVDSGPSWIGLSLCILFLYHHKPGIRMVFLVLLSGILNQDLKELFGQPRPTHLAPELGLIQLKSFGFPSGAAQSSVALFGFLAYTFKKQWVSWLMVFLILLISFSRVYLGAHFISDILGGWIVGAALLIAYLYALPSIERLLARSSKRSLYLLCALSCAILILLSITPTGISIALFELGLSLGLLWALPFFTPKRWLHKIVQLFIAFAGIALLVYIQSSIPRNLICEWVFSIISGIWVGWGIFALSRCVLQQRRFRN